VTYGAGGATREGTVEIAAAIKRDYGIETMAHLSCVGETVEGLAEVLDRIEAAGIENVLALRGDPPRGATEFTPPEGGLTSAAELAGYVSRRHPGFAIGGACFPEVHPEAPSLEADLAYLRTKVDNGATFLITQLFFDNRVFFDWLAEARRAGIGVPIIAGIMPITSYAQIQRFCQICEARIPEPLAEAMEALGGDAEAELELGIAYAARQCEELLAAGVPGLHFYTLNKAPATRAILAALRVARPWEQARGPAHAQVAAG
jgi:methylenetetrahydrofolate reductase (NADPH)